MWGTLQRDNVDPAVRRALEKIKEGRQEGWWEGKKGGGETSSMCMKSLLYNVKVH